MNSGSGLSVLVVALLAGTVGCSAPLPSPPLDSALVSPAIATATGAAAASGLSALAAVPGTPAVADRDKIPLVPAYMPLAAAGEVPANPLTDKSLDAAPLGTAIRWGFRLFTDTRGEAAKFVPGRVTCANCHMNAGQRERGLPVVAIAGMFPEYNKRAGRLIDLTDRVVECFLRSENATGKLDPDAAIRARQIASGVLPTKTSPEVIALNAYLTWLARDSIVGKNPAWRGQNTIAADAQIPLDKLDPKKGEAIYVERCTACHGPDGQGIVVADRQPAPLWGPDSWNDGAGAARVYTLAGMIRYTMPYVAPGTLTDEEAQHLAAFINSKPRPSFPFKDDDYRIDPLPRDAVYYRRGK